MSVDSTTKENNNKHENKKKHLLLALQDIAADKKWLSKEILQSISGKFKISPAEAYSVASFYSFIKTEPQGKNNIRVCKSISCDMKDKNSILNIMQEKLGIKPGETTNDGLFSLEEVNCIGWCNKGPAMLINDEAYTELTPDKVNNIIDTYISNQNKSGGRNE